MQFFQFQPQDSLRSLVECYWILETSEPFSHKVIPDGYPELIFHYGDHFLIKKDNKYKKQDLILAAGQLTKPMHLKASGNSKVLGVKLKPEALWKLFQCDMKLLVNEAIGFDHYGTVIADVHQQIKDATNHQDRVIIIEKFLLDRCDDLLPDKVESVIKKIFASKGQIDTQSLGKISGTSTRTIERHFIEAIGVSPKMYLRIIRFSAVFKMIAKEKLSRSDATYFAGYFDQSHFNRDFKTFSGEDPRTYFSKNHAFANFFMTR